MRESWHSDEKKGTLLKGGTDMDGANEITTGPLAMICA